MSIYNRKMFNRSARNALNASAGIQSFAPGGSVQLSGSTFSPATNTVSPLTQFPITRGQTNKPPVISLTRPEAAAVQQRTRPLTPFEVAGVRVRDPNRGISGMLRGLVGSDSPNLGINVLQQGVSGLGTLADAALAGAGTLGFPFFNDPRVDSSTGQTTSMTKTDPATGDLIRNPDGSVKVFEVPIDTPGLPTVRGAPLMMTPGTTADELLAAGVDITKVDPSISGGIPPKNQAFPRGVNPGQVFRVGDEGDRTQAQMLEETLGAEDADLPQTLIDPPLAEAMFKKREETETDTATQTGTAADGVGPTSKPKDIPERNVTESDDDTNQDREFPTSKEEIDRVINEGTPEEQQSTLDGFIKEFMDKAPGYEGADSGLVLAKIGFAMAAGKSPNAIENIASAMSDGADMLIKDKAKKDEFNRQLKLSALQYGFTETGKLRAEDRLEERERRGVKEMVVGAGGTTYKGKTYKQNESIFIDVGDIRDGTMPENITNTATLTALANQTKATNAALKQQLDAKTISLTEYQTQINDYRDAVTTAITSEVGIGLLEGAMVNTARGKVTGITPAVKDMLNKGANFFGMDLGKNYETLDDVRNAMRASLQDLIPVTLGAAQSANSISNRDVDFLIEAYFGAGALTGGSLAFAETDPGQMVKRLQRASEKMRDAQRGAFAAMNTVTNTLTPVFQPGTQQSAIAGLYTEQQRLAEKGLGTGGTTTFTSIGATRGDDGVIRLNLS